MHNEYVIGAKAAAVVATTNSQTTHAIRHFYFAYNDFILYFAVFGFLIEFLFSKYNCKMFIVVACGNKK